MSTLQLYKLTVLPGQSHPTQGSYDYYDSAVVVATSAAAARKIHPSGPDKWESTAWAEKPTGVCSVLIGKAHPTLKAGEIVCSSYNAG